MVLNPVKLRRHDSARRPDLHLFPTQVESPPRRTPGPPEPAANP